MKRYGFVSFVLLLLLLSTACNQQRPTGANVTVEGAATGTLYYQVGDGEWRRMPRIDDLRFGFMLPAEETRYGVALLCAPEWFSTNGELWVYQLTTEDATALSLDCGPGAGEPLSAVALVVTKAQGDTGNYDEARASLGNGYGQASLGRTIGLYARPKEGQGLLVWARDANAPYPIVRLRYDPGFDARPGRCPYDQPCTVELGPGDAPDLQSVDPLPLPPWAVHGGFHVEFVAHGWSSSPLTLGLGGFNGGRYLVVPNTVAGDLYAGRAWAGDGTYGSGESRFFGPQAQTLRFALPQAKFDPTIAEEALPTFVNLSYPDGPAAYLFRLDVYARGSLWSAFTEHVLVSLRWLGENSSFTVPDLSHAPGLEGTRPLSGDRVDWSAAVLLSDLSLADLLAAERAPGYAGLDEHAVLRVPSVSLRFASKEGGYTVP